MIQKPFVSGFALSAALLTACASDTTKDLGAGYTLVMEGGGQNFIFHENSGIEGVPPRVIKIAYDDDYIIAVQVPNDSYDVIQDREHEYQFGIEATYHWIIIKDRLLVKGPFGESEWQSARQLWRVPPELTPVHFY